MKFSQSYIGRIRKLCRDILSLTNKSGFLLSYHPHFHLQSHSILLHYLKELHFSRFFLKCRKIYHRTQYTVNQALQREDPCIVSLLGISN